MYRFLFRPIWLLFHLVVIGAIVLMINFGFWQLERLAERKEFNEKVIERSEEPPVPLSSVLDRLASGELDPSTAEWLPVTTSGTYVEDQVIEFNNSQNGRAGDDVLSVLVTDDGPTALVNRGFVALGTDLPPAPATRVAIVGYIRPSEVRDTGGLTDATDIAETREVRRIDLPAISQLYGGDLAPVFVQLIASDPEITPADPEPVVLPDLDDGPHLSYAIQWFIFAIAVAVGWVLAVRRSVRQRRSNDPSPTDTPSAPLTPNGSSKDERGRPVTVESGGRTAVGSN